MSSETGHPLVWRKGEREEGRMDGQAGMHASFVHRSGMGTL